ncbi:MAG TPA: SDR family NAD(P)-dependent oxidoreductase [Nitrososphaeraceae archaeon]|jgi:NAD(P)-dependent dehydrogenase (short-subunit alcohol dehydrogenase family)|nr:SDR family NAD(P)-dependent oxidoreductase [Nitrososphaeraceae archaeon]
MAMVESSNKSSNLKFSDKIVVITGSGTGIGQAVAKKFAEEGASIIIMGRRKEPLDITSGILMDIIKKVGSSGTVRAFSGVDVSDEVGINEMFTTIKQEFGKVDIIVNNAGVSGPVKTFTNASFQDFKDCVAIHLTGTFWTSVQGLKVMERGSKIITIATFFTEENKYEQRPYRFRTPYTAAQGAKNRLAEALAWELVEKGIKSVATNPGPVHSDRIYKTVYPKAAAEFLRIGGYPGLESSEVELAATKGLDLLGEPSEIFSKGTMEIAEQISNSRSSAVSSDGSSSSAVNQGDLNKTIAGMLIKIQEIAEKIQNNTSKMIVDNEFLSQEDVAEMVLTLSDDTISKLINGRIIPNDRVFYPVKPIVGTSIDGNNIQDLKEKVVVITTTSSQEKDVQRVISLANKLNDIGVKQVIILSRNSDDMKFYKDFHSHSLDLLDEEKVKRIFNTAKTKFGNIDAVIHFTGDYDYNRNLSSLSRQEWDGLVNNFIHIPALITREAVRFMAPDGAIDQPAKFKDSTGIIVILGPDSPSGKKISGLSRARSEVFRGALRPYTATVNQELSDVLGSRIRLYLILAGNVEGVESDIGNVTTSVLNLISGSSLNKNESIFYIDEGKKSN